MRTMLFSKTMMLLVILWLALLYIAKCEQEDLTVTVTPEVQNVKENGVASFVCHASGGHNHDVAWFKADRRITNKNQKYLLLNTTDKSVLRIVLVRRRDEGPFECRVSSGSETVTAIAYLEVYTEGRVPPGFPQIKDLATKVIEKNHNEVLQCQANGDPVPTVSWLKDYLPIDLTNPRLNTFPGGKLQIERAQDSDVGKYECVASNKIGVAYSNGIYVYVKERQVPPQFSRPPENVEVKPGGSVNLTCVAIGSPMPYVKWIQGVMELTPEGSLPPIGINVLRLTNVTQSTVYTCEASSSLGMISAKAEVRLKDLPKPPSDIITAEVTAESVTISWKSGNDDASESYIIRYRFKSSISDDFAQITDITDSEYTVMELMPYTAYEFQLMTVNSIGISPASDTFEVITKETAPSTAPENVRARTVSSSTVVVHWDQPARPNGHIQGYRVYYTLSPDLPRSLWKFVEVDGSSLLTTISNLLTNRTYSISVLAFTSIGSGPASDAIRIVTRQGVPDQPNNLRGAALSSTIVQLSWDHVDSFLSNDDSYEIICSDVLRKKNITIHVSPPQNNFQVENLLPNTLYSFRVAAKSSRGRGPFTPEIDISTLESAPSAAPQMVTAEAVDSTTIRVWWSSPPEPDRNGVITGYRVRYGVALEDASVASVPPTDTTYTMSNLRKWTAYRISVLAHTEHGDGPYSYTITVYTAEDVPGEPRRFVLEAINSTAIFVQWRPPVRQEQHGIIRGYQIHYMQVDDNGEMGGQPLIIDVMDGNETRSTIVGLVPDTEYQFQIAAYTRKGDGVRSRPKKIRTKGQAPENFKVTVTSSDPPSVLVMWEPPAYGAVRLTAYKLQFRHHGSEVWNEHILSPDTHRYQSTSDKLLNGVEYEFRLSAKNYIDFGDSVSQTVIIPGTAKSSDPPVNLRYSMQTPASVKLKWESPVSSAADSLLFYEISYQLSDGLLDDVLVKNSTETTMIIDDLKPSTEYSFQISACSSTGCGLKSDPLLVEFVDLDVVEPKDVLVSRSSPESITVTWRRPEVPPGLELEYFVYYCTTPHQDISAWLSKESGSELMAVLLDLEPSLTYFMRVRAKLSDDMFGPLTAVLEVKSSSENVRADSVQDFHASLVQLTSVRLNWSHPKKPGVVSYKIEYESRMRQDEVSRNSQRNIKNELLIPEDKKMVTIDNLRPNTVYDIVISAKFIDGYFGPTNSVTVKTGAALEAPILETWVSETVTRFRFYRSSVPIDTSNVSYFLIIVVPKSLAEQKTPDSFILSEVLSQANHTAMVPFIAGKFEGKALPETMDIGDESYPGSGEFLNRALVKDQLYRVFVRIVYSDETFVSSQYSSDSELDLVVDAESANSFPSDMELLWIVAPICAFVVILLLVILAVVFVRRAKRAKRTKKLPAIESPLLLPTKGSAYGPVELQHLRFPNQAMATHPPIAAHELAKHIQDLKENDRKKFSQEYESFEPGQQFTWDASNMEVNKPKNRYANVIAYDHSRVSLQMLDGVEGSDYINANFIHSRQQNAYIATQGPLPETFSDFWRMIWEKHCKTIVMMTKLEERNRIKCDQYWPNRGTEVYGLMQVTLADVIELASYTVRTFIITKSNAYEKREIRQFQFTAWPDHGVPDHPTPLLTFIRRVKSVSSADVGPIVIHCSAGVGRTGAFIVIDAMLDRLEQEGTLNIYSYVTSLRAQRNYMVQTEDQYVFIHEALLEAVESGNTEIPADNLYMHIQELTQIDPQCGISHMELEFKKISEAKMNSTEFLSGSLSINKLKNRLVNILPYDSTRVCLQSIRGVEGSDYINANYIDGYRNRRAYIATQGPKQETTEDFWRMLWENNCTIIVMLTKLREMGREKCFQYWPEERSARYQYFVVDPVGQYAMPQFILREFKVTDARDGQSRMIRQFHFLDWPEQGVPSSGEGFIEFIGHIQKTREQVGQDGPIIVHCSTGFGRTGVFLTLSIVLEQMRYEGVVDMFQTVKMLRTQRPAMVQTEDQYTFCYRAALEYLSSFDHYAS